MALPTFFTTNEIGEVVEQTKPLELNVDPSKLTVGELRLMRGYINDDMPGILVLTAEFLIHHTNWTEDEVNRIAAEEMLQVLNMLQEVQRNAAVPLVSKGNSDNGQAET